MTTNPPISVIVHTLNEEAQIAACLQSVAWADELLVVDMQSDDETANIALANGARVLTHDRRGFADPARQFGIDNATGPWILVLDADERVPTTLAARLRSLANDGNVDVWYVPEKTLWMGRWVRHGLLWPEFHPRFFRKGTVAWPPVVHGSPAVSGRVGHLAPLEELALVHLWRPNIDSFLAMLTRYAPLEAERLRQEEVVFRRRDVLLRPAREFASRFVRHRGYRDGFDGLTLALLFAFYRLVAVLKYWEVTGPRDFNDRERTLISFLASLVRD